jgi:hypothetical protein
VGRFVKVKGKSLISTLIVRLSLLKALISPLLAIVAFVALLGLTVLLLPYLAYNYSVEQADNQTLEGGASGSPGAFLGVSMALIPLLLLVGFIVVALALNRRSIVVAFGRYRRIEQYRLRALLRVLKGEVPPILKGLVPPTFFLLFAAFLTNFAIYLLLITIPEHSVVDFAVVEITLTLILVFVLPLLLPFSWRLTEWIFWRFYSLGDSTAAYMLRERALQDFELSISRWKTDKNLEYPFAVCAALWRRLWKFPDLHIEYKKRKRENETRIYDRNIERLIKGWKLGESPTLLDAYMKEILESSKEMDIEERLRGLCAVASVKYLSGDIREASALARKSQKLAVHQNPRLADHRKTKVEPLPQQRKRSRLADHRKRKSDPVPQWRVAYPYFVTKAFGLGKFEDVIKEMIDHWNRHYPSGTEPKVILDKSYSLPLNPILSRPRNIILTAAFMESAKLKEYWSTKEYWPDEDEFSEFEASGLNHLEGEQKWVECWYQEATKICAELTPSEVSTALCFDHAYAGFYFTLLYLDRQREGTMCQCLERKADEAFKKAVNFRAVRKEETGLTQHIALGFRGIYKLALKNDSQGALDDCRHAAQYSDFGGNRSTIADFLFMCCRAVAAQGTGRKVEADCYLRKAKNVAERVGGDLFLDIYDAARAQIYKLRGETIRADKIDDKLRKRFRKKRFWKIFWKRERAGERIVRLFLDLRLNEPVSNDKYGLCIEELIEGWQFERAQELLNAYRQEVLNLSKDMNKAKAKRIWRARGQFAVSIVDYLLGDMREAYELAKANWDELESDPELEESDPKLHWSASFTYFTTVGAFLGDLESAMEGMVEHWDEKYVRQPRKQKEIFCKPPETQVLHPALARPRQLILTAAFNEGPPTEAFDASPDIRKRYWPRVARSKRGEFNLKEDFTKLSPTTLEAELKWVECWYHEAVDVCERAVRYCKRDFYVDRILTSKYNHAFAGLYFILIGLDGRCDKPMKKRLKTKAEEAFKKIEDIEAEELSPQPKSRRRGREKPTSRRSRRGGRRRGHRRGRRSGTRGGWAGARRFREQPPRVLHRINSGFTGIFKLALKKDSQGALEDFRKVARYSPFRGSRFITVDFLFMCCHAVAAQRSGPDLKLEADRYLNAAKEAQERIGSSFYIDLYDAACAEIHSLRGNTGQAHRIDARLRGSRVGERFIRIFRPSFQKNIGNLDDTT